MTRSVWARLGVACRLRALAARSGGSMQLGVYVMCLTIEHDINVIKAQSSLGEAFGREPGGVSLIRPDGCIAWRAQQLPGGSDPGATCCCQPPGQSGKLAQFHAVTFDVCSER